MNNERAWSGGSLAQKILFGFGLALVLLILWLAFMKAYDMGTSLVKTYKYAEASRLLWEKQVEEAQRLQREKNLKALEEKRALEKQQSSAPVPAPRPVP